MKLPCETKHSTIIISNKELALLASGEYLKWNCLPLSRGDIPLESLLVGSAYDRIRVQHEGNGNQREKQSQGENLPDAGNSSKNWG